MPTTICKRSCAILGSLLFLFTLKVHASGGVYACDESYCNKFFAPEIIEQPDDVPFFRSHDIYYDGRQSAEGDMQQDLARLNREEWSAYFKHQVADENLNYLLYKMPLAELDRLIFALKAQSGKLSPEGKALLRELPASGKKDHTLKALYYLGYAKRCEEVATRRNANEDWESDKAPKDDPLERALITKLLKGEKTLLSKSTDPFLRERLQFQHIRLLFYGRRFAEAVTYYQAHASEMVREDSIKYRFIDAAAGSLYAQKKYAESNYLISRIFGQFPPMRATAFISFRPHEDADWQGALKLAQSAREKEVLWQLLGISADGLAAMQEIHKIDSSSKLLPLLVVREVRKGEEDWTEKTNDLDPLPPLGEGKDASLKQLSRQKRIEIMQKIAEDKALYHPAVWFVALEHLFALEGDVKNALKYKELALNAHPKNQPLRDQVRKSYLLAEVRALTSPKRSFEKELATELAWLDHEPQPEDLNAWILMRLSQLYKKSGDTTRAILLKPDLWPLEFSDVEPLDHLLSLMNQTSKSSFDDFLIKSFHMDAFDLNELRALDFLRAGRYAEAVEAFKLAGELAEKRIIGDPFATRLHNCWQCDEPKIPATYTKIEFATKMRDLAATAKAGKVGAINASLELGNATLYTSEFSISCGLYRSGLTNPDYRPDQVRALKYYQQVVDSDAGPELKATAAFFAARVEPGSYYSLLKEKFADTQYYKEIVRECGYFRDYLKKTAKVD